MVLIMMSKELNGEQILSIDLRQRQIELINLRTKGRTVVVDQLQKI